MTTPPTSARVLVVDDNRDAADTTAGLLRLGGFDVRVCYDGRTALDEAAGFAPVVCLLDLRMPGMEGDELARRLKAQAEDAGRCPPALVAVTAQSDADSRRRTVAAGCSLHLVKPVAPSDLAAVVGGLTAGNGRAG